MDGQKLKLVDIPPIASNLKTMPAKAVAIFHRLVFKKDAGRRNRSNLREFKGFIFEKDSEEYQTKWQFIKESISYQDLIVVYTMIGIEPKEKIEKVIEDVMDALSNLTLLNQINKNNHDDEDDSDENNEDDTNDDKDDEENAEGNVSNTNRSGSECNNDCRSSDNEKRSEKRETFSRCSISFKDIEDSDHV